MLTSLYIVALEAVPIDDWGRTWPAERTIMLRMTSKRVYEILKKIRPPTIIKLNKTWLVSEGDCTVDEKRHFIFKQLLEVPKCCSIITLELPRCLSADNQNSTFEILAEVLKQCPSLTRLDLSCNWIGAIGFDSFVEVLKQCPLLTHLDLGNNIIGASQFEILMDVLSKNKALSFLNLVFNNIGTIGAKILAELLPQWPSLTYLDISLNNIRATGMKFIAEALGQCSNLTHLKLSGNQIGDAGLASLSRVQSANGLTLESLNEPVQSVNGLTLESLNEPVLAQCKALTHLYIGNNNFGDAGIESLVGVLPQCRALTFLDIGYNQINNAWVESLVRVLSQKTVLVYYSYSNKIQRRGQRG